MVSSRYLRHIPALWMLLLDAPIFLGRNVQFLPVKYCSMLIGTPWYTHVSHILHLIC